MRRQSGQDQAALTRLKAAETEVELSCGSLLPLPHIFASLVFSKALCICQGHGTLKLPLRTKNLLLGYAIHGQKSNLPLPAPLLLLPLPPLIETIPSNEESVQCRALSASLWLHRTLCPLKPLLPIPFLLQVGPQPSLHCASVWESTSCGNQAVMALSRFATVLNPQYTFLNLPLKKVGMTIPPLASK